MLKRAPVFVGFAVFGAFWGTWGASIPALRDQAGVTDGQLGAALLCIGAGALPAMLVSGRLVDRFGTRVTAVMLAALGISGVVVAATAHNLGFLVSGLLLLGATSGASDVAINAAAGAAQVASSRPVLARAHSLFSACVVVSSLTVGLLHHLGAPTVLAFIVLAVAATVAAVLLVRSAPRPVVASVRAPSTPSRAVKTPLLIIGTLGALAFAVENAHQSWSAVFFTDVLQVSPGIAAAGPAVFAGVVAVTRLLTANLAIRHPVRLVVAGAATAAAGTATLGSAATLELGILGLAVAAAGTAVLFPTLLAVATADIPDAGRGAATSLVTTVAYLGFLAGPVYVGAWAGTAGLPAAMLSLAGLALLLTFAAYPVLAAAHRRKPTTSDRSS